MNKKIGFTLAEVLVTLSILGVVAGIAIPSIYSNFKIKNNSFVDKQEKELLISSQFFCV